MNATTKKQTSPKSIKIAKPQGKEISKPQGPRDCFPLG